MGKFDWNAFLNYCDAAKEFFEKSPKECLQFVKEMRDNYFSAFFLISSHASKKNNEFIENFKPADKYRSDEAKGLEELARKFEIDCNK